MTKICAICGAEIDDFGNNPYPVRINPDARCCNACNSNYVLPARIATMSASPERIDEVARKLDTKTPDELDIILS